MIAIKNSFSKLMLLISFFTCGCAVNRDRLEIDCAVRHDGILENVEAYYINDSGEKILHGKQYVWDSDFNRLIIYEYEDGIQKTKTYRGFVIH